MLADGRLDQSLALATVWHDWHLENALNTPPPDPLQIDLPPVLKGSLPSPQAVGVMGNLYLMAELEQAGLVPAVEALVDARLSLPLHGVHGAAKLEDFHIRSRNWYDRDHRNLLYARLFGIGPSATNEAGATVNRTFEQSLALLCVAIQRYARDYEFGQSPAPEREVAVRQAAADLTSNLANRVTDSMLYASQHLQEQLQHGLDILGDPDIGAMFGTRGVWSTLRAVLGDQTPDLARLVSRGQYGQRLIQWIATILSQLDIPDGAISATPLLSSGSPVFHYAAEWLAASAVSTQPASSAAQPALVGAA
jgi:hypothetical protein